MVAPEALVVQGRLDSVCACLGSGSVARAGLGLGLEYVSIMVIGSPPGGIGVRGQARAGRGGEADQTLTTIITSNI